MSQAFRKVVKRFIPHELFRKIEPFGHLLESVLANICYGFPARSLRVIGVTGTNGKTTTSFMIHQMLTEAGVSSALMTTVGYGVGSDITPQVAHMTTVSAFGLQKRLREYKKLGVKWVVLETTSHALAQNRVWGVPYEVAVLTNITHEHLDYHGTYQAYVAAKRRMFEVASRNKASFGVINADDPNVDQFVATVSQAETYGINAGALKAEKIELTPAGSSYVALADSQAYRINCHIPGEFNVYNSLAAVGVGRHLGLTKAQIEAGIASLKGVEGRMDVVSIGQEYSVVIDFAHTPDSFERLLADLRQSTKGKLVVMFGSAGRRDEAKRAIQGEIAGRLADEVILTEEDDRDCDGNQILAQIAAGAEQAGKIIDDNLFLRLDRQKAIEFAMTRVSGKDDAVVLLGKGHEKTIERADGEHPWNETEEAKRAIGLVS